MSLRGGGADRGDRRVDRLARAAERLHRAILESDRATTPAEVRRAAFDGTPAEPLLSDFVEKVRVNAYRVGDGDVAALREHGLSDDAIFEVTVAAALGAAERRLAAGLARLDQERGDDASR